MKMSKSYHEDNWKEIMAKKVRRMEILIGIMLIFLLSSLFDKVFSRINLHKHQYDISMTLIEVEKSVSSLFHFKDSVKQTFHSQGIPMVKITAAQTFDTYNTSSTYAPSNTHQSDSKSPKVHTYEELNKHDVLEQEHDVDDVQSNPNLEGQGEGEFENSHSTNRHRSGENFYESKNNIKLFSSPPAPARNVLQKAAEDKQRYRNESSVSRKLEKKCNGTMFQLEIQLDASPSENSWTLTNLDLNALVENVTFDSSEPRDKKTFEKCLVPGPYHFIIQDSNANGINCDDPFGCYNIYMDGKLYIRGSRFSREQEHIFDSTSLCVIDSLFPLKIQLNSNSSKTDFSLSDIQSKKFFEIKPFIGSEFSYFACLPSGLYDLTISTHSSYQIFMRDEVIFDEGSSINEEDIFSHVFIKTVKTFTHEFILTSTGHALKNPICHKKPMLAPYNIYSNYTYDERMVEIIDTIRGMTSSVTLNDLESPQYKAACFMVYDDILKMEPNDWLFTQRYALVTLLYATNQPAESIMQMNTCEYYGLKCATTGSISQIEWSYIGLTGSLPSEISRLQSLEIIHFGGNSLQGTIPPSLGLLTKLESLKLEVNEFTGVLPSQFGNLSMLKWLTLGSNNFRGTIPTEISRCSLLDRFGIFQNKVTGSIPSEFFECIHLSHIDLSNNKLTSTIPTNIGQLDELRIFHLDYNKLTGPIPSEVGKITSLENLDISNNALDGSLPEEIGNLYLLHFLVLSHNFLTGTISNIFGNLTNLESLNFMDNDFSGSIPDSIWSIDSLRDIRLNNNKFTGTVPQEVCTNKTYENIRLDDSEWFKQNPSDYNDCNPSVTECYVFSMEKNNKSPPCPIENKESIEFFSSYNLTDTITDVTLNEFAVSNKVKRDFCLSPTGCYELGFYTNSKFNREFYYLNYNSSAKSLFQTHQDECDPVNVSGVSYGKTHYKRAGLNHLTQLAVPEFHSFTHEDGNAKHKALSWIMHDDELFDQHEICDGTLLQRFVLAYFYISQESLVADFDSFLFKPTCEWEGVICDAFNIVTELEFRSKNLEGTLISEIGLLAGLRSINFFNNRFTGTIPSDIFDSLTNLEFFDVTNNTFEGTLPKSIFSHPNLKKLIAMNNTIAGSLPDNIEYPKSLEEINMRNNVLQGAIPTALLKCENIRKIELAQNGLSGTIPSSISNAKSLEVLYISENKLSGSIPSQMFELPQLVEVKLNTNSLTGNIPENVGVAKILTRVWIHHNKLKGTIPDGFENLTNLKVLNLHDNNLFGLAPNLKQGKLENYTTDCGDPSFLLPQKVECGSCLMCCNSEKKCQLQNEPETWWEGLTVVTIILLAPFLFCFFGCITYCKTLLEWIVPEKRDSSDLYRKDSIYCLVFSADIKSILLYFLTVTIQMLLFGIYLKASFIDSNLSDYEYSYRCISEGKCIDTNEVSNFGWSILYVVILVYLGKDILFSYIQVRVALSLKNWCLGFSGIIHFVLSGLALITSIMTNHATAENNTDLITNAVILLFVNDIDEQMLGILQTVAPNWTKMRLDEVETFFRQLL